LFWYVCGHKGHVNTCRYLLEHIYGTKNSSHGPASTKSDNDTSQLQTLDIVNAKTVTGNTPLMWASWSGSLNIIPLLLSHGADPNAINMNGCGVSHWAASGGYVTVCQYLFEICDRIDFRSRNSGGNTPLNHAVAWGRVDVVQWLLNNVYKMDESEHDAHAIVKELNREVVLAQTYLRSEDEHCDKIKGRRRILNMLGKHLDQKRTATEKHCKNGKATVSPYHVNISD